MTWLEASYPEQGYEMEKNGRGMLWIGMAWVTSLLLSYVVFWKVRDFKIDNIKHPLIILSPYYFSPSSSFLYFQLYFSVLIKNKHRQWMIDQCHWFETEKGICWYIQGLLRTRKVSSSSLEHLSQVVGSLCWAGLWVYTSVHFWPGLKRGIKMCFNPLFFPS